VAKTRDQIIADIESHINNNGADFGQWYVGIASSPRDRLFNDHNVRENGDAWIFREATSSAVAREVENYFINVKGTQGGAGGGDYGSRSVYAYKIKSHTRE
jgi:hypothetical protein